LQQQQQQQATASSFNTACASILLNSQHCNGWQDKGSTDALVHDINHASALKCAVLSSSTAGTANAGCVLGSCSSTITRTVVRADEPAYVNVLASAVGGLDGQVGDACIVAGIMLQEEKSARHKAVTQHQHIT
jgi:hypothetical protein